MKIHDFPKNEIRKPFGYGHSVSQRQSEDALSTKNTSRIVCCQQSVALKGKFPAAIHRCKRDDLIYFTNKAPLQ